MEIKVRFLKLSHELIVDTSINTYEFRIYIYLMSLYNKEKGCSFPSQETISKKLSIGLTTVKKSIRNLKEIGYIKVEKQKRKIGHYNKYSGFKHMINDSSEGNIKKHPIVSDYKEAGVQIYMNEVVEDEEQVKILSVDERKQKDIDNSVSVRIARKYTNIDSSKFAKELISELSESLVRIGCSSFKDKLELGKLKENCASNLLKECIDVYLKEGIDLPKMVFNKYKKIDNLLVQPSKCKLTKRAPKTLDEYEKIRYELGIAL
ncbi:MAG: helix-turn-helix domain-containing protein [Clostridium sp.]|nr:helix-turn-helix domain-containing protein [Clostridium sp.]